MKSNGKTTILNWVLAVVVVALVGFAIKYFNMSREVRSLQAQISIFQNNQAIMNNLISEAMQYSRSNPSIDPILESVGAKPAKNPPAAAAKPAGK